MDFVECEGMQEKQAVENRGMVADWVQGQGQEFPCKDS